MIRRPWLVQTSNLTHLGFRMIRICNLVADNDGVFHFRFISGAIIKGQRVERPRNRVLRGWIAARVGMGGMVTPHVLRHSFATTMISNRVRSVPSVEHNGTFQLDDDGDLFAC